MYTTYNFSPTYVQYPSFQTQIIHWRNPFREGAKEQDFDEIIIKLSTIYNDGEIYAETYIIDQSVLWMKKYDLNVIIDNLKESIKTNIKNRNGVN